MKIFCLDGVDNSGKSTLAERLYSELVVDNEVELHHFPSDDLVDKHFGSKEAIEVNKKDFINDLINETRDTIVGLQRDGIDVMILDRLTISTFVYQGTPKEDNELNEYIYYAYRDLFEEIGIDTINDIYYFIFPKSICNETRDLSTENKQVFDDMIDVLEEKTQDFIERLGESKWSKLFQIGTNVSIVNKPVMKDIDEQQQKRFDRILYLVKNKLK